MWQSQIDLSNHIGVDKSWYGSDTPTQSDEGSELLQSRAIVSRARRRRNESLSDNRSKLLKADERGSSHISRARFIQFLSRSDDTPKHDVDVPKYVPLQQILSPQSMRLQLVEGVLQSYFGHNYGSSSFCDSGYYGRNILQAAKGPTMQAALDSLCLAHVATVRKDERILHEARRRRLAALVNLRRDIASPMVVEESLLGAVYLLAIHSMYAGLGDDGAKTHLLALQNLLLARGSSRPLTKMGKTILLNFMWLLNKVALRERKDLGLLFKSAAWQEHLPKYDPKYQKLNDMRFQLPSLLERLDNLTRPDNLMLDGDEVLDLQAAFASLENHLHAWVTQHMSSQATMPYRTVQVNHFSHFAPYVAGLPPSDRVFSRAWEFAVSTGFMYHGRYWIDMLLVKTSLLELSNLAPVQVTPSLRSFWEAGANECADNLCRSIMWLTQPREGQSRLLMVADVLYFAGQWYSKSQQMKKLRWCQHIWAYVHGDQYNEFYHGKDFETGISPFVTTRTREDEDCVRISL